MQASKAVILKTENDNKKFQFPFLLCELQKWQTQKNEDSLNKKKSFREA